MMRLDDLSTHFGAFECCIALQCVAVCCSVLQYVAVCCSALQSHSHVLDASQHSTDEYLHMSVFSKTRMYVHISKHARMNVVKIRACECLQVCICAYLSHPHTFDLSERCAHAY